MPSVHITAFRLQCYLLTSKCHGFAAFVCDEDECRTGAAHNIVHSVNDLFSECGVKSFEGLVHNEQERFAGLVGMKCCAAVQSSCNGKTSFHAAAVLCCRSVADITKLKLFQYFKGSLLYKRIRIDANIVESVEGRKEPVLLKYCEKVKLLVLQDSSAVITAQPQNYIEKACLSLARSP